MADVAPPLSVIIINWNGAEFLRRLFDSLRRQELAGVQVILADNNSTDGSVALTRREYPEVEIVEFPENLGYAEGNNRAAAFARAPYLFFLNNDTHVDPKALARLVDVARREPRSAILAPQVLTYDGTRCLGAGMSLDVLGYPLGSDKKVFYADGAAFFIRRDLFHDLGGFDAAHFMFYEETDLCWRAALRGYRVRAVWPSIIYHKAGGTAGTSIDEDRTYTTSRRKRRLTHRNHLRMLLKNYSAPTLVWVLPLFAALTAAEITIMTATGEKSLMREVFSPAWADLIRERREILAMRRTIQSTRTVSDWGILWRMRWTIGMINRFRWFGVPKIK